MLRARTALLVFLALATILFAGCAANKEVARVISAWPTATVERTVAQPPTPPRWPLTGLVAPSAAATDRRAMSVKIENSVAARPQTGLQSADVVYEEITEGGITRFNAIFQSKLPKVLGPVRSARLADLYIVPQYNYPLFFYAGANMQVERAISKANLPDLSDSVVIRPYYRASDRRAPHNLYLDTSKGYVAAKGHGYKLTGAPLPLEFLKHSGDGTVTVSSIYVPFSTYNKVLWTYEPATKSYKRTNNGNPFIVRDTGKQLRARNVVVMWAQHVPQGVSKWGSAMYKIVLVGSGRAVVFRDGQQFPGTWTAAKTSPPRFKDGSGKPVQLERGNTWIQVVMPSTNITLK